MSNHLLINTHVYLAKRLFLRYMFISEVHTEQSIKTHRALRPQSESTNCYYYWEFNAFQYVYNTHLVYLLKHTIPDPPISAMMC